MFTHTTLLISKMDPIKYIFEKPALSGRIARWKMILTEYDIQYTTQKAIKGSVLVDHLAHQAVEDYQSMKFEFPDEDIMTLDNCKEIYHMTDLNKDPDGPCSLMGLPMHLVMVSALYSYLRKGFILPLLPDFASTVRTTWRIRSMHLWSQGYHRLGNQIFSCVWIFNFGHQSDQRGMGH